jgi:hypothetical protein
MELELRSEVPMVIRKSIKLVLAVFTVFGCSAGTGEAERTDRATQALEVGGECVVADAAVQHSCAHANFGPFQSVAAQPYPGFVFTDISTSHTLFTVSLAGSPGAYQGGVLYSPGADGMYAFFTAPGVSLQIFDAASQPVAELRGAAVPEELCGQIEQVAVFELSSTQTYTVVYGPTESATVETIVEYVGGGSCDVCSSVDLDASLSLSPYSRVDGAAELDAPIAFEIPDQIAVIQGTARFGTATLSYRAAAGPWVHCLYGAKPSLAAFKLLACSGSLRAGDDVEADRFKLRVNPGAALLGSIGLELELEDEACHAHEEAE